MARRPQSSRSGFTLIELMIVAAIMGILASIAIPNFYRFQLRSKTSEAKVNISAIRSAQEAHLASLNTYVSAGQSPALAEIGSTKVPFVDAGAGTTSSFDELGWAPEGPVFFSYGIAYSAATPSAYTISATADLDESGAQQAWGYVKPVAGTNAGLIGLDPTCLPSGAGSAQDLLSTVAPCASGHGISIF